MQNKVVSLPNQLNHLKIPPHDLTVEQAILGIIILYPESIFKIKDIITPDDFYRESHRIIFDAILSLKEPDIVTLHTELVKRKALEQVGGDDYLAALVSNVITSGGLKHYADTLKDLSYKRQIIALCSNVAQLAFDQEETDSLLSDLKGGIRDIETNQPVDYIPNHILLANRLDVIVARSKGEQPGYLSGIQKLDDKIFGFWPSYTYVLMAKSQSGKSSLALNIADNVAVSYPDKTVEYYILESSKEYLTDRRLTRASQIPLTRIQKGNIFNEGEWEELNEACNKLPTNIRFHDDGRFASFERLVAHLESESLRFDISFVVIDYLQCFSNIKGAKNENRHLQLSHIASRLGDTAKIIKAPILYISSVNKEGEAKESGDIFYRADVVMKLNRETNDEDATLEGLKGRDLAAPFFVPLRFKKNTQTWWSA